MIRIFFLIIFLFPAITHAQIHGKVTDAETGEGLEGVSVSFKDNLYFSGPAGEFEIPSIEDTLQLFFRHLGYREKSIRQAPGVDYIHAELQPLSFNINELVVAAPAFRSRLLNSTGSIQLIPEEIISDRDPVNIAEIINNSPGVYMASGSYNTNRLTIRGIGSRTPYGTNRIRAYLDHIPLTNGDGITNIEDIDAAGIGRIEIIKGPASAIYGSGLGGVVRIYPERIPEDGIFYSVKSEASSFQTYRNTFRTGFQKNNKELSVIYNNSVSEGYRDNSEYERNSFMLFASWFNDLAEISLTMNYIDLFAEIPSSLSYEDFTHSPASAAANWQRVGGYEKYQKLLTGLTAEFTPHPGWENKLSIFSTYADPYESRPFNILDEWSFNAGLRNTLTRKWKKISFLAGTEIFSENFRWKIFETQEGTRGKLQNQNQEKRQYINLFLHSEVDLLPELKIVGGLNFNYLRYSGKIIIPDSESDPEDKYYHPVSPSFGLNYETFPFLHLYINASHGFSAPSVEESLMPEGTINPDLKAEKGWSFSAGFRGSHGNRLYYDVSVYQIRLNDLLVTRRISEEVFYGINAGKAHYSGVELFMKYNIFNDPDSYGREYSLTFSGNLSENKFKTFISDGQDFSGNILPGIPEGRMHFRMLVRPLNAWSFTAIGNVTGSMYLNDENSLKYGSYNTVDFKTTFTTQLSPGKKTLRFSAGIRNLFDRHYASMILVNAPSYGANAPRYYYPGLPRNFFVGISLSTFN